MVFLKTTIKKIALMELLTNYGENPYKAPVKKLISSNMEAVVLWKGQ